MKTLVCCVAVGGVLSMFGSVKAAQRPSSASAHLWPYVSLCKLPEPPDPIKEYSLGAGASITTSGCSDLETQLGHPTAVRLHFVNPSTEKTKLVIKGLGSISVKGSNASTALAIQLRGPSPFGSGWTSSIATKLEGEYLPTVPAGGALDLVVLFKSAAVGDSVALGDQPPMKIEK